MKRTSAAPKHNPNLINVLLALKKLLDDFGAPWTLIGGVAAAILGKPRFTADVDAVILIKDEEISEFIIKARKYELAPRLADAEAFAFKNRVILLRHMPSGIGVDISIGLLPFEIEAINRSKLYKIGNVSIRMPKVEEMIIFKAVAHRPQDMLDIQEMLWLNQKIDKKYLENQLKEFSAILENSAIWDDVKDLLKKKRKL